jgi:transposase-like protein
MSGPLKVLGAKNIKRKRRTTQMRNDTRKRKNATAAFEKMEDQSWWAKHVAGIIAQGKTALDMTALEIGKKVAEAVMYIEREEYAGPDYHPKFSQIRKWASQEGSVYMGDQKIKVSHPRMRGPKHEIELKSYAAMKRRGEFSEEMLAQALRGMSGRKYAETVIGASQAFGVSPSSVSRHLVEITSKQLQEFRERNLEEFKAFAILIDSIHRGGRAFVVGLGVDLSGTKQPLGFWEGATENSEICEEMLSDLERRGLKLSKKIVWVTDGGKGVIKALKNHFGSDYLHQRCIIHKDRNIQKHLPKRYRREAHSRFMSAFKQNKYEDAKSMLTKFEQWLRDINDSAAESLLEALDELLTAHRLGVPSLLRTTLCSTNPIESMFSTSRHCERNIKRYRNSKMRQRWLASVLLYCEQVFHKVEGHKMIAGVINTIETLEMKKEKLAA